MGLATAAVGLLPTFATIGVAAPALLVVCRAAPGAGARRRIWRRGDLRRRACAAEPARLLHQLHPGERDRRLPARRSRSCWSRPHSSIPAHWEAWGWRVPFIFSLLLLAVSLWVRLKLKESPVFRAMKEAGETARNPLKESFDSWPKVKLVLVALFGIAAGLTVIWYTAQFQGLYFLQNALRIEDNAARLMIGIAAAVQRLLVRPVRLAVRQGRPQEADRDRLCADHRADVPALPLDGRGGESGAVGGDAAQPRRRHRQRLQLPSVRQGPADGVRQGARRAVEEGGRLQQGGRAAGQRAGGDDRRRAGRRVRPEGARRGVSTPPAIRSRRSCRRCRGRGRSCSPSSSSACCRE